MKLADGRRTVAVAGTPVALGSSTGTDSVAVTALSSNSGVVCVGSKTVKAEAANRTGTPLGPGQSMTLDTDDLADVFIDATVSGEGVSWTAVVVE